MILKRFFYATLLITLFAAPVLQADDKPGVVTTIYPLTLIAGDLAGDWLEVRQLLPNNQDAHHVSLKISQRQMLAEADLLLWAGPDMETFLAKAMSSIADDRKLSLADASTGVSGIADDPHYWLQPDIVARFYGLLAARLKAMFPRYKEQIEEGYERALKRLDSAKKRSVSRLAAIENKRLVVDHNAYLHYTDYFGIAIDGALVDHRGMAAGVRSITSMAGFRHSRCMAVEQLPASRSAGNLANQMGLTIVEIDPLGRNVPVNDGYGGLLASMLQGFLSCFEQPE